MTSALRILASVLALCASLPAQADSKPILIGQTYVQSGPLASLGTEPLVGIRAMLKAVNATGGINGRPVELKQLDDAYDAARAADNVKKLEAEGAVAILMPIGTTSSMGALKAANELKIPLIAPYTGAGPVVKFSEYGFPVRISFDEEYGRIVNHLFTVGITRIAFAHNDNPGARSAMESTRKFVEERGSKMVGSAAIQNDGSDAEAKAVELAKLKPTAVVLSATNAVAAKFIKAYRASGAEARFYSFSFLNGQQLQKDIGADAVGVVVSQVVPYPWNPAMPILTEYQAAMKKMGATELSYGSLEGYVSTKVLIEGLKRAGANPTPESLKKALETFKSLDLGGIFVRYGPTDHQGMTFSELSMLRKDGGYVR
ncbi:MAG: ABC transporter substrate-binding protein [Pseudomonadota bacterium]|uniref:ABC transporter substrate-binding protein n=1 Tax=Polaromonas sp. TaxID=1869339 RepID=UPI0017E2180B|nr:ABC transporter substrate-binding protein [Polaromonas sp.]MBA3592323.1 ABC transporter substrate-binding protein [Polaromonas sp.]MDQ3272131.1 ABC transporter substrate-binding protein [Pseudomonadota bacterium]